MKRVLVCIGAFFLFNINVLAMVNEDVKYFKTEVLNDGIFETVEISEEEFENVNDIMLLDSTVSTEYKKISLKSNGNTATVDVEWKKTPYYRSYDVVALRGEKATFGTANMLGKQYYSVNNTIETVLYRSSSANVKVFNNGFGISMNLVDDSTYYHIVVSVPFYTSGSGASIYATYQHSQADITFAQSQKYTIGAGGYGNVLKFDNSVKSYFDNMSGVSISV